MTLGLALAWAAILVGCWLGWQLLRQNGRLLLRLDELEERLDELEFGEDEQPAGLRLGSEAPSFELPGLAGDRLSLAQFRGRPLLVIFFNPGCGFCRVLLPRLKDVEEGRKQNAEIDQSFLNSSAGNGGNFNLKTLIVIISTGDPDSNRQLFDKHQLNCPVLLQKEMEVISAYNANGTPCGYLVSPEGKIASGLAIGAETLLEIAVEPRGGPHPQPLSHPMGEGGKRPADGDRNGRFNNRSLARSKIKRDGLKAGTIAPDFRFPRLDGRGDLTLSDLRGRRVLLVFSSPGCGPCNALAPQLEKFHREQQGKNALLSPTVSSTEPVGATGGEGGASAAVEVVLISQGEPKENRAKVKEHGLTFPIVLQQQWEISRRYAMFATPIAYLINEEGIIVQDVAVGTEAIQALLAERDRDVGRSPP